MQSYDNWKEFAKEHNYKYLLIAKDTEDLELFPVYFNSYFKYMQYANSIISVSNIKIIELINVYE